MLASRASQIAAPASGIAEEMSGRGSEVLAPASRAYTYNKARCERVHVGYINGLVLIHVGGAEHLGVEAPIQQHIDKRDHVQSIDGFITVDVSGLPQRAWVATIGQAIIVIIR